MGEKCFCIITKVFYNNNNGYTCIDHIFLLCAYWLTAAKIFILVIMFVWEFM